MAQGSSARRLVGGAEGHWRGWSRGAALAGAIPATERSCATWGLDGEERTWRRGTRGYHAGGVKELYPAGATLAGEKNTVEASPARRGAAWPRICRWRRGAALVGSTSAGKRYGVARASRAGPRRQSRSIVRRVALARERSGGGQRRHPQGRRSGGSGTSDEGGGQDGSTPAARKEKVGGASAHRQGRRRGACDSACA